MRAKLLPADEDPGTALADLGLSPQVVSKMRSEWCRNLPAGLRIAFYETGDRSEIKQIEADTAALVLLPWKS
jgi:hypothetical protein